MISDITVSSCLDKYLIYINEEKHFSDNTVSSYRHDISVFISYLDDRGIEYPGSVSSIVMENYILFLEEEGYKASSIIRNAAAVKSFYEFLKLKNITAADPAADIKLPEPRPNAPVILTVREVDALLAAPSGDECLQVRDKAILELLYASGMRVSELIKLRPDSINQSAGYVRCRRKGKIHIIPLGSSARTALTTYISSARWELLRDLDAPDDLPLFLNYNGRPLSRQGLWKIIKKYAVKAGITGEISPDMLRHSLAVHLIQQNGDLSAVRRLLG